MDLSPLSYAEIKAWAEMMAVPLTPRIAESLRKGSEAFISGQQEGAQAAFFPALDGYASRRSAGDSESLRAILRKAG